MGEPQRGKRERVSERIPEFWIRPQDKRGRPLDARVLDSLAGSFGRGPIATLKSSCTMAHAPQNFWSKSRWRCLLGFAPSRKWNVT